MKKPKKKNPQPSAQPPQSAAAPERAASAIAAPVPAAPDSGSEPVTRSAAVPALLFAALGALLFWGDVHLLSQGGEMDARVYYPFESIKEVDSFHIKAAVDPRIEIGRAHV